ncbi:MAG: aldolase, partial [Proteobacteria bacterium]|nr:aldolase [Pseudomonadota bacterium]
MSALELVLFSSELDDVRAMTQAGVDAFMVDCEWRGKENRQSGADTEIAPTDIERVGAFSKVPGARVYCRVNGFGPWTADEVNTAIALGADRVFLPMARDADDIARYCDLVAGRAEAAILVETQQAVDAIDTIAAQPIDAVYVGLNDLAITRGTPWIWGAVTDGTVERVRDALAPEVAFGFGGAAVLGGGHPLPVELLLAEMARLRSDFTFLRR